jgi:succinyl-CoA synthetase beta subunit
MDIHEYQAKELFASWGIPVMAGGLARNPEEVAAVAASLQAPLMVVKAQVHAGGRGKGGGVRLVKSVDEAVACAREMMSRPLVTPQTGPEGRPVSGVYVEMGCDIRQQYYLALMVDRGTGQIMVMASSEGGMEIEEVARQTPERIVTLAIDPVTGYQPFHGRRIARHLGCTGPEVRSLADLLRSLYTLFTTLDMSLVEINPLVLSGKGEWFALDAKVSFDDNALFRHPPVVALRDRTQEDPAEAEATQHGLSYVRLEGNIGCMVNGAGLAMATMDMIQYCGGRPANFLDVGGGATRERVTEAFRLVMSDPRVEGILVNIFGGIMRCDIIAQGVVEAARHIRLNVPLVVRLEGTNVEEGNRILRESGLPVQSAQGLEDAAVRIVQAVAAGKKGQ